MLLPETILTARLLLRPLTEADAPAIFEGWAQDPEVTRHVTWQPHESVETVREFLRQIAETARVGAVQDWLAVRAEDGAALGMIGYHVIAEHHLQVGYVYARSAWGRGHATEALSALLEACFDIDAIERVDALCHVDHAASSRVLIEAGMPLEGRLRRHSRFPNLGNEPQDVLIHARTRP